MSGLDLGADLVAGNRARASDLNDKFDAIKAMAGSTPGRIIICNSSGVPVSTAVTGDVLISSAGATSIQAGAVDTTELAAGAATSAKVDLSYEQDQQEAVTVGASYAALAEVSVGAGVWSFNASASFDAGAAGALQSRIAVGVFPAWERGWGMDAGEVALQAYTWISEIGSTTTVSIQGMRAAGGSGTEADAQIAAVRIG